MTDASDVRTNLRSFFLLSRPHFVGGAALLYALGASAAVWAGHSIDWDLYWTGQATVTSIQLMTHYANEYFDVASDRGAAHRTWLSGGSGVLTNGRLAEAVAIRAAAVAAVAAGGLVIWTYLLEPAAGLIAVVAMLAGWFYSAPPLRLESTGAGEAVASVVVAVLVPVLAVVIQGTSVPAALWWMAWGLAGLQFAAMLAFALPDVDSDRRAGKLTLAVRLGRARSPLFQGAAVVVSLGALATGAALRVLPAPFLLLGVPALISGLIQVITARSDRFTLITMSAAATLLLAISAAIGSFLIGTEV